MVTKQQFMLEQEERWLSQRQKSKNVTFGCKYFGGGEAATKEAKIQKNDSMLQILSFNILEEERTLR